MAQFPRIEHAHAVYGRDQIVYPGGYYDIFIRNIQGKFNIPVKEEIKAETYRTILIMPFNVKNAIPTFEKSFGLTSECSTTSKIATSESAMKYGRPIRVRIPKIKSNAKLKR